MLKSTSKKILTCLLICATISGCNDTSSTQSTATTVTTSASNETITSTNPLDAIYADPDELSSPSYSTDESKEQTFDETPSADEIIETAEPLTPMDETDLDENILQGKTDDGISVEIIGLNRIMEYNKPIVLVQYKIKNNSSSNIMFDGTLQDKIFQKGIQRQIALNSKYNKSSDRMSYIQPGKELTTTIAYELDNANDDIDVIIAASAKNLIEITINKDNVVSQYVTKSIESDSKINISIESYYITKDANNKSMIVVNYNFTHFMEYPMAWIYNIGTKAFQNETKLSPVIMSSVIDMTSINTEIKANTPHTVTLGYYLVDSKSPITLSCGQWIDDDIETLCEQTISFNDIPVKTNTTSTQSDYTGNDIEKIYILDISSKTYHIPECHLIKNITTQQNFLGTSNDLLNKNFKPCDTCRTAH
ncbi:DUF5067 domain-containing protein [bacterium]|nr:DUF5067 domain-containing protein [bacterium]